MPTRQTITLRVTTPTGTHPGRAALDLLSSSGAFQSVETVGVSEPVELPELDRERLVQLAAWAAGEKAKQDLGLPSEWNQGAWLTRRSALSCGTACCIAGKVALEDGAVPIGYTDEGDQVDGWGDALDGDDGHLVRLPNGEEASVETYAREALGLTEAQAARLFDGNNRLEDLLREVRDLLGQP